MGSTRQPIPRLYVMEGPSVKLGHLRATHFMGQLILWYTPAHVPELSYESSHTLWFGSGHRLGHPTVRVTPWARSTSIWILTFQIILYNLPWELYGIECTFDGYQCSIMAIRL